MTDPSVTKYLHEHTDNIWGWHAFTESLRDDEDRKTPTQNNQVKIREDLGMTQGTTLITGGTCAAMRSIGILHTLGFRHIHLFGFDCSLNSYPPHNIIKEDENKFCIEMALAGFKKDEIKVTWQEDLLTVEGDRGKRNDNENYVYKSIGHRTFKKIFSLSELVEVMGANFERWIF